jgi:hypothetical protein
MILSLTFGKFEDVVVAEVNELELVVDEAVGGGTGACCLR